MGSEGAYASLKIEMAEQADPAREPWRAALWTLGLAGVVAGVLLTRGGLPPYDDAFFFGRFARNLFEHGTYAWNVQDGPVHGNTSQLFQVLVTAMYAAAGDYTAAATRLVLAGSLVGAAAALGRWGAGSGGRWLAAALAFSSPVALATVVSGMETAVALLLGALFLGALTLGRAGIAAGLAVALFATRPDTALLTLGTLGLWVPTGATDRSPGAPWLSRRGVGLAAAALGGMLGLLLLYRLSYGTAFPLSFYLKSGLTEVYDARFLALSRDAKLRHFACFLLSAAPLLALIARAPGRSWRLAAPAALFLTYQLAFTVDVMGLHGRFFVPALPWLAAAAAAGVRPHGRRLVFALGWGLLGLATAIAWRTGWLPQDTGWAIGRVSVWSYGAAWAAGLIALLPGPVAPSRRGLGVLIIAAAGVLLSAPAERWRGQEVPTDADYAQGLIAQTTSWRGLNQLTRCLGTDLHVYHSEIGVPGVLLPDGRITDLGGLMNPALALEGADVDAACLADQPDAIFLPHRNYTALNAALTDGACLRGYTRVVKKSSSPLYVRTDRLAQYRCE